MTPSNILVLSAAVRVLRRESISIVEFEKFGKSAKNLESVAYTTYKLQHCISFQAKGSMAF